MKKCNFIYIIFKIHQAPTQHRITARSFGSQKSRPTGSRESAGSGSFNFQRFSRQLSISSYGSDFSSDFPMPKSQTIISGFYADLFVALKPLPHDIGAIAKNNTKVVAELRQLIQLQVNIFYFYISKSVKKYLENILVLLENGKKSIVIGFSHNNTEMRTVPILGTNQIFSE